MYSKVELGEFFKKELAKGFDIRRISLWADEKFIDMRDWRSVEIENILQNLMMMNAGPEFEYTENELNMLADMLINNEEDAINKLRKLKRLGLT